MRSLKRHNRIFPSLRMLCFSRRKITGIYSLSTLHNLRSSANAIILRFLTSLWKCSDFHVSEPFTADMKETWDMKILKCQNWIFPNWWMLCFSRRRLIWIYSFNPPLSSASAIILQFQLRFEDFQVFEPFTACSAKIRSFQTCGCFTFPGVNLLVYTLSTHIISQHSQAPLFCNF